VKRNTVLGATAALLGLVIVAARATNGATSAPNGAASARPIPPTAPAPQAPRPPLGPPSLPAPPPVPAPAPAPAPPGTCPGALLDEYPITDVFLPPILVGRLRVYRDAQGNSCAIATAEEPGMTVSVVLLQCDRSTQDAACEQDHSVERPGSDADGRGKAVVRNVLARGCLFAGARVSKGPNVVGAGSTGGQDGLAAPTASHC
jgi:hypothetical protein